ncbi:MAG TPA: KGG domain-containing protein [Gemmatimonadaceae bacterium]|nr:KGG domain-containing protein [Gemmatimonadaceae bacterium]
MADQSNNRGNLIDQRGESGGALDGNGIARGGSSGVTGRNGNSSGGDGIIREGGAASGAVSRKTPRGFAAMDPQAQRAIAAKGGRAAHQKGTAHEFTSEEARVAGRKGGEASRGGRRSSGNNT